MADIYGTSGPDNLSFSATPGDDNVFGLGGNDLIGGGLGNNVLNGGNGFDYATFFDLGTESVTVDLAAGYAKNTYASDPAFYDTLVNIEGVRSGAGNDFIYGKDGFDALYGGDGNDYIDGRGGNDFISGGTGNDWLVGGDGNDALYGDTGNDILDGGAGDDHLNGGDGVDTVIFHTATTVDLIAKTATGGDGNDTLFSIENVQGSDFNDTILGTDGFNSLVGGAGDDVIDGRGGNDYVIGGDGNDIVNGGDGNDLVYGNAGNDRVFGDAGDDVVNGGLGVDNIWGGTGNDTLYGGAGASTDTFFFAIGDGNDKIMDFGVSGVADVIAIAAPSYTLGSDGSGGTLITYGSGDSIDVVGKTVTASNITLI